MSFLKNLHQSACTGAGTGRKQATEKPSAFSGDLSLDGLRVNQLKLSRNLTGSILLSNEQFQIRAKVSLDYLTALSAEGLEDC